MPVDPNKFTRKTGEALQAAQALAREQNHAQVGPEHLLAVEHTHRQPLLLQGSDEVAGVAGQHDLALVGAHPE